MADGLARLPVMAEGRWQMARCPSDGARGCRGEGRLGCRCCSAKPCAGADTPRLTAREASGERARLRTSRRAADSGHRSARPAPARLCQGFGASAVAFAEAEAPDSRCSTGDPDDLPVLLRGHRSGTWHVARHGRWQMADGMLPVRAEGRWQMAWHVGLSWQMEDGRWHVARQTERAGAAAKGVWVVGAAARSRAQGPTRLA